MFSPFPCLVSTTLGRKWQHQLTWTWQISYLSSSQGFAWNPEIFLPSYVDYDYVPLENRREPVHEILLSDEEIKKILPN